MVHDAGETHRYAPLSVCARLAAGLHGLVSWLDRVGLNSPDLDDLIEHLWSWPQVTGPGSFHRWYDEAPDLVGFALGDEIPAALADQCGHAGVAVEDLRRMAEPVTEIVYFNLFAAVNDQMTLRHLGQVGEMLRHQGLALPPASLFRRVADRAPRQSWIPATRTSQALRQAGGGGRRS